jgi:regulatory protein
LNFLSYRARSLREVSDRLSRYGYDESTRAAVVEWLTERGYVDDVSFAEQFAEERTLRKGYGPRRVAADLAQKGVDRETAEAVMDKLCPDSEADVAPAAIAKAAQRWERLAKEDNPQKRKSKLVQYLQRRGFQYSVAIEILERVATGD